MTGRRRDFIFWGIRDRRLLKGERDLLGVVKADNVDEALGIANMFLKLVQKEGYVRFDIQYCIKDFQEIDDGNQGN